MIGASLLLIWATPLIGQQAQLEHKVKELFLHEHGVPNLKQELQQLGERSEVVRILIDLVAKHKYARESTLEALYLAGATDGLGELRAQEANTILTRILLDMNVHENVRTLAARSLGKIDSQENEEALLKALDPKIADYPFIRIEAAKALAQTGDPAALSAIERAAAAESDKYVKQQLAEAASQLKRRIPTDRRVQPKR
jgi:HEAT repeat protein